MVRQVEEKQAIADQEADMLKRACERLGQMQATHTYLRSVTQYDTLTRSYISIC